MSTPQLNTIQSEEQPESSKKYIEEEMPENPKRRPEAHRWELTKGGETFTFAYFPPLKPILLIRK